MPPTVVALPPTRWDTIAELLGAAYLVVTVGASVAALLVLRPYMTNDFFWASFGSSNTSRGLLTVFETQLTLASHLSVLDLSSVSLAPSAGLNPAYARLVFYGDLATVEAGIAGLGRLDVAKVTYLMAPYCWVDLEKHWEMAHTFERQARCGARYAANGAVHLEAVLRNVDLAAWLVQNDARFQARIAGPMAVTPRGEAWRQQLYAHVRLPVADEVAVWKAHNLTEFHLQYANYVGLGVQETIYITNAMGYALKWRLKTLPSMAVTSVWSTASIFAPLEYDLVGIAAGESLVRNTSSFWADINPSEIEVFNVGAPLAPVNQALHDQIGPLMSIDLRWVAPPPLLLANVAAMRSCVLAALRRRDAAFHRLWSAIPSMPVTPTPVTWRDITRAFLGGNPMCYSGMPLPFVQESFGFDDACGTQQPLTLITSPFGALFAVAMQTDNMICHATLPPHQVAMCLEQFAAASAAWQYLQLSLPPITASDVAATYVQFTTPAATPGNATMLVQSLLAPDWAYFGWMSLYDWAMNEKEVVSFEGDIQTLWLMSYAYTPMVRPEPSLRSSLAVYLAYCAAVVTIGLAGVALLLLLVAWHTSSRCSPWLGFNCVVGSVWLNRNVLACRALAAAICLATAQWGPSDPTSPVFGLEPQPRSLLTSGLLAGDVTWTTLVAHETLQPLAPNRHRNALWPSAVLTWLLLLLVDQVAPVQATASIARSCYSVNMATLVYCDSGVVVLGSYARLLQLGACSVLTPLAVTVFSRIAAQRDDAASPGLLYTSACLVGLRAHDVFDGVPKNVIARLMCGFVSVPWRGRWMTFDTKLWRMVSSETRVVSVVPASSMRTLRPSTLLSFAVVKQARRWSWHGVYLVAGATYMVFTLLGNVTYLSLIQASLANDYYVAGFNSSGMHAFLANVLNRELLSISSGVVALDDASRGDINLHYDSEASSIQWGATLGNRLLLEPSGVSLESVVRDLRAMDPCQLPWMATQYCWLDLERQWAMASTAARQARCEASMTANGAVYLEAPLRNMNDWTAWQRCWGDSFQIGIAASLHTLTSGQAWLQRLQTLSTSINDEAALWRRYGLTSFDLQWQNYKTVGLTHAFHITNALGVTYSLPLGDVIGSFHPTQQTSMRAYWTLASDLWAVATNASGMGGRSLLASSPAFAFVNVSGQALLARNLTLPSPLRSGLVSFTSRVGPFNAVDMLYVAVPDVVSRLVASMTQSLAALVLNDATARRRFYELAIPSSIFDAPGVLINDTTAVVVGGNILCGNDNAAYPASVALYKLFGTDGLCFVNFAEQIYPTTQEMVVALAVTEWTTPVAVAAASICRLNNAAAASCASTYMALSAYIAEYAPTFPSTSLHSMAADAKRSVATLNVQLTQYVDYNDGRGADLFSLPLFDESDPAWAFYGWCYVYEWATGGREVIRFEGDEGAITAISHYTIPQSMAPDPASIPASFAAFCQYAVLYVTLVLIATSGLVATSALYCRGRIEGLNFFCVNRLVGLIWVGRTLLVLRTITALSLLSTVPLALTRVDGATQLVSPAVPWFKTILAASEVTWLVYVLNDVLSCVTLAHTASYAFKSSNLAWLLVAIWSMMQPQRATFRLQRACTRVDMDAGLVCVGGTIEVGSWTRLQLAVLLAIACVVGCYLYDRWRYPNQQTNATMASALALNAQSVYLLRLTRWTHDGETYLDTTSAILAGLLVLEVHGRWYVFDIKTWRWFCRPRRPSPTTHLAFAIPLCDLS
ncbi:hypothetical protein SDRG_04790 [Saprolegnia diclina VS20]|uniref:Uncharacterized protein n=1 Tax=Saprolegnia diclina (strain VS20) TaxID=1156394 RepID=T0RYS5_SAPDV|nr:hypothetical protein SDRG_04790 [Saprolegnia diclina VS20]EQC37763.1 hypothetical protein SDRG_04790 [Saprolegnia diclina VS20]|eukprot:XP_008608696.1 hypothetical protein SDRG_04790 [Saprolegnia diclina VS20]